MKQNRLFRNISHLKAHW